MNETATPHGPYETEADAYADCQHVYTAFRAANERGLMGRMNRERFNAALAALGVELGAFDTRITAWYPGTFEPETVQVFIGLLERAYAAGQGALREEITDLRARIAVLETGLPAREDQDPPVHSWVVYRPAPGSEILEPAGVDGEASPALDPAELAVAKLIEYATGAPGHMVKVYGVRGQLAAWAQWEDGEPVAYLNGDAPAAYVHALPGIDLPGRLAGAHRGPRCGAWDGRTALFMADVTCPVCLEQINAAAEPGACARCGGVFDPADTAFDGRARYRDTRFCRGCVEQCHDADAGHRCVICRGGAR